MSVPVEVGRGGGVGPQVNTFEQVSSEQTFIHIITMGTPLNFDRVNNGHWVKTMGVNRPLRNQAQM